MNLDFAGGGVTPAVHTRSRSRYSDGDCARAIVAAINRARDIDAAIPVGYGGEVVGVTYGLRGTPCVKFLPLTHRQWCGFGSYGDLQAAVLKGQTVTLVTSRFFNINSAWVDLWPVGANANSGDPYGGDYSGTAATARQFTDATLGAIQNHFVPGGTKTMFPARYLFFSDQSAPGPFCLYDRVLSYDNEVILNGTTTMTNTLPALRYVAAGQPGLYILVTGTTGTAVGATPSNLTTMTYVDNAGNPGQLVPTDTVINWGVSASASTTTTASACVLPRTNLLSYSPFMPLAPGDTGVRSITDYTSSAANTGQVCMALVRPLGWLSTPVQSFMNRIDLGRDLMTFDRVYDGACLSMLARTNQNQGLTVQTTFAWG